MVLNLLRDVARYTRLSDYLGSIWRMQFRIRRCDLMVENVKKILPRPVIDLRPFIEFHLNAPRDATHPPKGAVESESM